MDKKKQAKIDLIHYLMVKCDMLNGRITDMSKEDIDDTWYEEEFDEIIDLGKRTCGSMNGEKNNAN